MNVLEQWLLVHTAPQVLVSVVGLATLIRVRSRSPRATGLAIFALSLKLLSIAAGFFFNRWAVAQLARGVEVESLRPDVSLVAFLQTLVDAGVLAILIASVLVAVSRTRERSVST